MWIFLLQIISPLQVSINFSENEVNNRPFRLGVGGGGADLTTWRQRGNAFAVGTLRYPECFGVYMTPCIY